MSDGPTLCSECDHVHTAGKNDGPWKWMCIKHPRLAGYGFVTGGTWENFPPYLFCRDTNGGACPLFKRKRDGQMEMMDEPAAHS